MTKSSYTKSDKNCHICGKQWKDHSVEDNPKHFRLHCEILNIKEDIICCYCGKKLGERLSGIGFFEDVCEDCGKGRKRCDMGNNIVNSITGNGTFTINYTGDNLV